MMLPPGSRSRSHPPQPPSPKLRESRAVRVGLVVSAVAHLLLLALYPSLTGVPAGQFPQLSTLPEDSAIRGIELIDLRELVQDDPLLIQEPPPPSEPVLPEPAPPPVAEAPTVEDEFPEAEAEEEEAELTIAGRLQPRFGDPRVWAPIPSTFTELTEFEQAEIMMTGMLQSWNDSMVVAQALADRARDWTYTDASGRRWGLGAGRLYLGDFSIPLPAFEFAPGLIEDRLNAGWIAGDLARGAAAAVIRETWSDRARIIRERMEAERDQSRNRGDDGGSD